MHHFSTIDLRLEEAIEASNRDNEDHELTSAWPLANFRSIVTHDHNSEYMSFVQGDRDNELFVCTSLEREIEFHPREFEDGYVDGTNVSYRRRQFVKKRGRRHKTNLTSLSCKKTMKRAKSSFLVQLKRNSLGDCSFGKQKGAVKDPQPPSIEVPIKLKWEDLSADANSQKDVTDIIGCERTPQSESAVEQTNLSQVDSIVEQGEDEQSTTNNLMVSLPKKGLSFKIDQFGEQTTCQGSFTTSSPLSENNEENQYTDNQECLASSTVFTAVEQGYTVTTEQSNHCSNMAVETGDTVTTEQSDYCGDTAVEEVGNMSTNNDECCVDTAGAGEGNTMSIEEGTGCDDTTVEKVGDVSTSNGNGCGVNVCTHNNSTQFNSSCMDISACHEEIADYNDSMCLLSMTSKSGGEWYDKDIGVSGEVIAMEETSVVVPGPPKLQMQGGLSDRLKNGTNGLISSPIDRLLVAVVGGVMESLSKGEISSKPLQMQQQTVLDSPSPCVEDKVLPPTLSTNEDQSLCEGSESVRSSRKIDLSEYKKRRTSRLSSSMAGDDQARPEKCETVSNHEEQEVPSHHNADILSALQEDVSDLPNVDQDVSEQKKQARFAVQVLSPRDPRKGSSVLSALNKKTNGTDGVLANATLPILPLPNHSPDITGTQKSKSASPNLITSPPPKSFLGSERGMSPNLVKPPTTSKFFPNSGEPQALPHQNPVLTNNHTQLQSTLPSKPPPLKHYTLSKGLLKEGSTCCLPDPPRLKAGPVNPPLPKDPPPPSHPPATPPLPADPPPSDIPPLPTDPPPPRLLSPGPVLPPPPKDPPPADLLPLSTDPPLPISPPPPDCPPPPEDPPPLPPPVDQSSVESSHPLTSSPVSCSLASSSSGSVKPQKTSKASERTSMYLSSSAKLRPKAASELPQENVLLKSPEKCSSMSSYKIPKKIQSSSSSPQKDLTSERVSQKESDGSHKDLLSSTRSETQLFSKRDPRKAVNFRVDSQKDGLQSNVPDTNASSNATDDSALLKEPNKEQKQLKSQLKDPLSLTLNMEKRPLSDKPSYEPYLPTPPITPSVPVNFQGNPTYQPLLQCSQGQFVSYPTSWMGYQTHMPNAHMHVPQVHVPAGSHFPTPPILPSQDQYLYASGHVGYHPPATQEHSAAWQPCSVQTMTNPPPNPVAVNSVGKEQSPSEDGEWSPGEEKDSRTMEICHALEDIQEDDTVGTEGASLWKPMSVPNETITSPTTETAIKFKPHSPSSENDEEGEEFDFSPSTESPTKPNTITFKLRGPSSSAGQPISTESRGVQVNMTYHDILLQKKSRGETVGTQCDFQATCQDLQTQLSFGDIGCSSGEWSVLQQLPFSQILDVLILRMLSCKSFSTNSERERFQRAILNFGERLQLEIDTILSFALTSQVESSGSNLTASTFRLWCDGSHGSGETRIPPPDVIQANLGLNDMYCGDVLREDEVPPEVPELVFSPILDEDPTRATTPLLDEDTPPYVNTPPYVSTPPYVNNLPMDEYDQCYEEPDVFETQEGINKDDTVQVICGSPISENEWDFDSEVVNNKEAVNQPVVQSTPPPACLKDTPQVSDKNTETEVQQNGKDSRSAVRNGSFATSHSDGEIEDVKSNISPLSTTEVSPVGDTTVSLVKRKRYVHVGNVNNNNAPEEDNRPSGICSLSKLGLPSVLFEPEPEKCEFKEDSADLVPVKKKKKKKKKISLPSQSLLDMAGISSHSDIESKKPLQEPQQNIALKKEPVSCDHVNRDVKLKGLSINWKFGGTLSSDKGGKFKIEQSKSSSHEGPTQQMVVSSDKGSSQTRQNTNGPTNKKAPIPNKKTSSASKKSQSKEWFSRTQRRPKSSSFQSGRNRSHSPQQHNCSSKSSFSSSFNRNSRKKLSSISPSRGRSSERASSYYSEDDTPQAKKQCKHADFEYKNGNISDKDPDTPKRWKSTDPSLDDAEQISNFGENSKHFYNRIIREWQKAMGDKDPSPPPSHMYTNESHY